MFSDHEIKGSKYIIFLEVYKGIDTLATAPRQRDKCRACRFAYKTTHLKDLQVSHIIPFLHSHSQ